MIPISFFLINSLSAFNDFFRLLRLGFNLPLELYLNIALFLIVIFRTKVIKKTYFFYLLLLCLAVSFISGFLNNTFSIYSIRTFYIFLMPIVMMNYGNQYYSQEKDIKKVELKMKGWMKLLLVWTLFQSLIYILLFIFGIADRVGASLPLIIPITYLSLYQSNLFIYLYPLILISGKRASFVSLLILGIDQFSRGNYINFRFISKKILYFISLVTLVLLLFSSKIFVYLERWTQGLSLIDGFENLFQIDQSKIIYALDIFSSGRVEQIMAGIDSINNTFLASLIGIGSGAKVVYPFSGEVSWYVHNTFVSYAMQCGYVLSALIFYLIFYIILKYRKKLKYNNSFAYLYVLIYIPTFFLSSSIFINSFFWFFLGALNVSYKNQKMFNDIV